MSSILDIPDEPRRERRGPVVAVVAAAVVVAIGVVVARTFALGGWNRPLLAIGCVTALPALVVAWLACGPHRSRTAIAAAAAIVGVVVMPLATSGITPSTARLSALADDLGFPGQVAREVRIGDGRCRAACSEVRRTTIVDGMSFAKAYGLVVGTLKAHGYNTKRYAYAPGAPARIDAARDKLLISLEVRAQRNGRTRIAAVFLAKGPAPDTSVG